MKYIYIHVYTYIVNAKSFSPLPLGANLFLQASFAEKVNPTYLKSQVESWLGSQTKKNCLVGYGLRLRT